MKYKFEISVMSAAFLVLSFAGVASADSVIKTLYVDGNNMGQATATMALSFPYPRLTIGSEGNRYFRYNGLVGEIDEFAVFGGVLTDANVAKLYSAGSDGYVAAVTNANPLLYLQFEDDSSNEGDKAANTASADINSTYIGAVDQNTSGFVGKAAILHGADAGTGDCIDVCDWDQQLSKTNISVAFWVKTTQAIDYPRFFQHNGATGEQHSYGAMYNAETNAIGLIGGGSTRYFTKAIDDNDWHHVVVTFASLHPGRYEDEVMADDPCVYLKFDNQFVVDSSVNGYVNGRGAETRIEKTAGGIGKSLFISNAIDPGTNVAYAYVWNNWYPDSQGHRNREESPAPPNQLNRNDNYAFAAKDITSASEDITFEIWVKTVPGLTPDAYAILFQQVGNWHQEANAPFIGLSGNDPNTSTLRIGTGWEMWYTGARSPLDGNWHQIVVTYDENEASDNPGHDMGIQLYVDGSLAASRTAVEDVNHPGAAKLGTPEDVWATIDNVLTDVGKGEFNHLMIGSANDKWYTYNCWAGYMDEFAIYGGVLSADRIAMHFAAWQPKDCAEVRARGLGLDGDLDMDCDVDLFDYASFASQWATCNTPGVDGCTENWLP